MLLRVLWGTHKQLETDTDWEIDYIRNLFDQIGMPYTLELLRSMDHIVPGALIVMNRTIPYMEYLSQYEQRGFPFGILHLSDEWFQDDVTFYQFSMCKFAFRNYYHERFDVYPKVQPFALGYKRKFWEAYQGPSPRTISYHERPYVWSFAGAPRTPERQAVLQLFANVQPNKLHFETGDSFFQVETGLDTHEYRQLLLQSKFVLCAPGVSNTLSGDTFRVTEGLECGAIPIVIAGRNSKGIVYWESLYGALPPFVIGETWEEALAKTKALVADPVRYEELRIACYDFWQTYKKGLGVKMGTLAKDHLLF